MCSLSTLDCALATVVLICFRNVRLWSTKEFSMFGGWDWFLVYLEWRDVFLGVFLYSSSNDQLGCFVFI